MFDDLFNKWNKIGNEIDNRYESLKCKKDPDYPPASA